MKVRLYPGGELADKSLYDLLADADRPGLECAEQELVARHDDLKRQMQICGQRRWSTIVTEPWPLAEAIAMRAQLEALEHVLVVIRRRLT